MLIPVKIIAALICVLALIVTFRTEYVLKTFFRVESPDEKAIMKTKMITLIIAIALFIAVLIIFK